jgi:hypothetical protein
MTVSPKLALLTVLATLGYLGLAVLGWGGLAAFFSHPPLAAVAVITFALSAAALFTSGNVSSGEREDRGNRWVLVAFGVIGLAAAYLPAYTDRKDFWTIDGDAMRWLGVALFAVGGALRIAPVFVLGRRFSGLVAIQPGHTLVTDGISLGRPPPAPLYNQPQEIVNYFLGGPIGSPLVRLSLTKGMIAADFLGDPTDTRVGHALPNTLCEWRTDSRKLWAFSFRAQGAGRPHGSTKVVAWAATAIDGLVGERRCVLGENIDPRLESAGGRLDGKGPVPHAIPTKWSPP